jgi:hypothetical protein
VRRGKEEGGAAPSLCFANRRCEPHARLARAGNESGGSSSRSIAARALEAIEKAARARAFFNLEGRLARRVVCALSLSLSLRVCVQVAGQGQRVWKAMVMMV